MKITIKAYQIWEVFVCHLFHSLGHLVWWNSTLRRPWLRTIPFTKMDSTSSLAKVGSRLPGYIDMQGELNKPSTGEMGPL